MNQELVLDFNNPAATDVAKTGGKIASLAVMTQELEPQGIRVPPGFAITVAGYTSFLAHNALVEPINARFADLAAGRLTLQQAGRQIREMVLAAQLPPELQDAIRKAYAELSRRTGEQAADVAVRSSATAEDLPGASFAGQHESFLNVVGEAAVLATTVRCYASLFTDRAITYRQEKGFAHMKVGLSVGVQQMVRSDVGSAGVMFSIDTETGFPHNVVISAAWGLGESVVQGAVTPDQYVVFKPLLTDPSFRPIIDKVLGAKETEVVYASGHNGTTRTIETPPEQQRTLVLNDDEILQLARWAVTIEAHYGVPMDMEWAKDGKTGEIFLVQARPETVQSERTAASLKTYRLKEKGRLLVSGMSVGEAVASGPACVIRDVEDIRDFVPGAVLITSNTSPDWVPIMKQAAAIVTDHGGRTSHAAIVSRELGIPAIVGAGDATGRVSNGQDVTVSCAEGDEGHVYEGLLDFETTVIDLEHLPQTRTHLMINIADPAAALQWWRLPCRGVGLARIEFIINNIIKVHPLALLHLDKVADAAARREIEALTLGYEDKGEFFVERLAWGIAKIAASRYPDPVIVRMSDFKTNEYAGLLGGRQFEPEEENPMLGFRGASRYYSERYRDGFALECRAVKRVREEMGLSNVVVMIPFCRTPKEADDVLATMAQDGLRRGDAGLEVFVMAEIPANVILAKDFASRFDGFSIGSNDLTQLTLGVDRDAEALAGLFDERNEAVKRSIADLIERAHKTNTRVGICGQAPSDYPEYAAWLVEAGIDSISVNPDSVARTLVCIAEAEAGKA
jgi:pyruvate, water dikinase